MSAQSQLANTEIPLSLTVTGGTQRISGQRQRIVVTGALTSNATLTVPANGSWDIQNQTTGAFSLTIKTLDGTGVPVTQGTAARLMADGVNVVQIAGSGGGAGGVFDVSTSYATAGAINPADNLSVITNAASATYTLANGAALHQIQIHNYGTGTATISVVTLEGGSQSVALAPSPAGASATLLWSPTLSSWIIV